MKKTLNILDKYILLGSIFLYPLFFLPYFSNSFEIPKLLLLVIAVVLISIVKILKIVTQEHFKFRTSKIDLLVLALSVMYLLSTIFVSPNKMDAFLFPGITSFILLGSILYFFINQNDDSEGQNKKLTAVSLSLSAFIYAIVQILSFTGVLKENFTNFGNLINSLVFLLSVLPLSIYEVIKNRKNIEKAFFALVSFVIFVSISTIFYLMLPGKPTSPNLPSLKSSWTVSIDSLKQNPVLGVGSGNFLYSYTKFRPISANSESNWTDKFIVARNTPLTVMSEVGIIGLIVFIALFLVLINVFKLDKIKELDQYKLSLVVLFILSFVYPFSSALLPIVFMLFALNSETKEVGGMFNSKIPLLIISVPFAAMVIVLSYISYKGFYGEYLFGKTLKYITENNALKAYETVNTAVSTNPYVDRYHLAAAEINIAIAQSLSKKEGITEEDKKTVAELIQQSIREGKASVSLNKTRSSSWESLGNIYVNISPFAKDASGFAIQSYNQAVFLNPIDPNLRIKLGGIYFSGEKVDEAIKIFELAVLAKPDFANSHYNLAIAYKAKGQIEKAKEQIEIVLKLVDANSKDYGVAKAELDSLNNIKAENDAKIKAESENLTPPAEPVVEQEPQVEIPQ